MINSNSKGKRGELELVNVLKQLGFEARRTQQYSGAEGTSDVTIEGAPSLHVECKYDARPNIQKAMQQADNDRNENSIGVVCSRRVDRRETQRYEWLLTVKLADLCEFVDLISTVKENYAT